MPQGLFHLFNLFVDTKVYETAVVLRVDRGHRAGAEERGRRHVANDEEGGEREIKPAIG